MLCHVFWSQVECKIVCFIWSTLCFQFCLAAESIGQDGVILPDDQPINLRESRAEELVILEILHTYLTLVYIEKSFSHTLSMRNTTRELSKAEPNCLETTSIRCISQGPYDAILRSY